MVSNKNILSKDSKVNSLFADKKCFRESDQWAQNKEESKYNVDPLTRREAFAVSLRTTKRKGILASKRKRAIDTLSKMRWQMHFGKEDKQANLGFESSDFFMKNDLQSLKNALDSLSEDLQSFNIPSKSDQFGGSKSLHHKQRR